MFGPKKFRVRWKLLYRTEGTPSGLSELWPIFHLRKRGSENSEGDWIQIDPWNKDTIGAYSGNAIQYRKKYDALLKKAQKDALKKHPETEGKGHSAWTKQTDKMIKQREKEIRKQKPKATSHEVYQQAYSEIMRGQVDSLARMRSSKAKSEIDVFRDIAPEIEYEFEGVVVTIPYDRKVGPFKEPYSYVRSYVFFIQDEKSNTGYRKFEVSSKKVDKFLVENHLPKRNFPFRRPSLVEKKESQRRDAGREADYRIGEMKKHRKSKRQKIIDDIMKERGWNEE